MLLPDLTAGLVLIYQVEIRELAGGMRAGRELLTPGRRGRLDRYRKIDDQLRCLGAGLLQRLILQVTADEDLYYSLYGQPYLARGGPHFSLAHAGEFVHLAVAAAPLGVDVEIVEPEVETDLAVRCLTPEEYYYFRVNPDPGEFFCRAWTGKESLMKATGLGMNLEPRSFAVLPRTTGRHRLGGVDWHLFWRRLPGHWLALATREAKPDIQIIPIRGRELLTLEV